MFGHKEKGRNKTRRGRDYLCSWRAMGRCPLVKREGRSEGEEPRKTQWENVHKTSADRGQGLKYYTRAEGGEKKVWVTIEWLSLQKSEKKKRINPIIRSTRSSARRGREVKGFPGRRRKKKGGPGVRSVNNQQGKGNEKLNCHTLRGEGERDLLIC